MAICYVEAPELWPLLRTRYEEEHSSRAFHETLRQEITSAIILGNLSQVIMKR